MCKLLCVFAILLAVSCYQVNGQLWFPRTCRTLPVVQDFNITRYLGGWFEQSRYDYISANLEIADCVQSQYSLNEIPGQMFMNQTMNANNTWFSRISTAIQPALSPGVFNIFFDDADLGFFNGSTIQVIQTDYVTHSVVWSCRSANNITHFGSIEFLWILTRDREPSANVNFAVTQFITQSFQLSSLRQTEQHSDRCGAVQIYAGILLALIMSIIVQFVK